MTVSDPQVPTGGADVTELDESVEISTEEGRRLAERLADNRPHARKLLEVRNLSTQFFTREGTVHAVDEVSFDVDYGETLGLVGESGCGKSVTALSLVRLVPDPPGQITEGQIIFDGIDILKLSRSEMRRLRGRKIGFIFQDPMTSLNPTLPIGFQISESAVPISACRGARPETGRSSCCRRWASRGLATGWGTTPTSSAAACASG